MLQHEVTHALGFASGADFRNNDLEMPDLIRFQRTDGTGNYNPDSLADFTTTPRLVDYNSPNDDHNSDLIDVEYRMSDGSPYQASHFREQTQNIGLMDPAIGGGQTYVNRPDTSYYSQADLDVLDFMGYDLPAGEPADPGCSGADLVAPYGVLNFADVQVFLGLFATQDSAVDYAAPQGVFNFADVQVFLGLFSAGCE